MSVPCRPEGYYRHLMDDPPRVVATDDLRNVVVNMAGEMVKRYGVASAPSAERLSGIADDAAVGLIQRIDRAIREANPGAPG